MAVGRQHLAGFVDVVLEGDDLASPVAPVGGDDDLAAGIGDALDDGLGGESAEDHRVDRADPGAREHRDGQLGDHGHVDCDDVAFL